MASGNDTRTHGGQRKKSNPRKPEVGGDVSLVVGEAKEGEGGRAENVTLARQAAMERRNEEVRLLRSLLRSCRSIRDWVEVLENGCRFLFFFVFRYLFPFPMSYG